MNEPQVNKPRPHEIIPADEPDIYNITLIEGKHAGIIFRYGKVKLPEDNPVLQFHYDVVDACGVEFDKAEFEQELGDFLIELLFDGVNKNDIVYSGGLDADRGNDSNESDL